MTTLRGKVCTDMQYMGIEREGMHTKGLQWDVVKRLMERRVGREKGQDLQVGLDPGDGLEEKGRSTSNKRNNSLPGR